MKYTKQQFDKEFPNDAICLDRIFQLRYGSTKCCPRCGKETTFRRISTRRSYQCRLCYNQLYPCAGTPFEKTRTPLNYWFFAMYLMVTSKNGVSAKQLERMLGVTYKTAFKMAKQIRILMGSDKSKFKLDGFIEMDETYVGGMLENRKDKDFIPKTPVFAMVERMGEVRAVVVPDATRDSIHPVITDNIDVTAKISTDESHLYKNLSKMGFQYHRSIKHSMKQFRYGNTCTNTVEGFFSQLKRMIYGTHIHVSPKHLQKYVDDAAFRYNHRDKDIDIFGTLILKISTF